MRFDPERVITLAEEFAGPRLSGTEGEFRAGRKMAELLAEAGWQVEVREAAKGWGPSRTVSILIVWLVLLLFPGLYFVLALKRHLLGMPLALCVLVPAGFVTWVAFRIVRAIRQDYSSRPSEIVVARYSDGRSSRNRLIVMTRLTTQPSDWSGFLYRLFFFQAFLPGYLVVPVSHQRTLPPGSRFALFLIAVQFLATFAWSWGYRRRPTAPTRADNRTGLALLAELARCWPKSAHDRVETWLVALPNSRMAERDLRRSISDGVPTIMIDLDLVGVGPELRLGGDAELARSAADSLWIPYSRGQRVTNRFRAPLMSLSGAREDLPIDSKPISQAEQLVVEIAFRWGRSAEHSTAVQ